MNMQPTFVFLAGCGFMAAAGCTRAETNITVCDLANHPHQHQSHRVQVSGEVNGGLDRLLLSDQSCPNKPIALSISNDVASKPHVAPLWSAIYREGNIGTVGKHIRATVSGTFGYEQKEWPGGILTVEDVGELDVRTKREKGPE